MNNNPNTKESASQCGMILEALKRGETITPLDAIQRFGCMRLGARIWDLEERGHSITKRWVVTKSGKRVMSYSMAV